MYLLHIFLSVSLFSFQMILGQESVDETVDNGTKEETTPKESTEKICKFHSIRLESRRMHFSRKHRFLMFSLSCLLHSDAKLYLMRRKENKELINIIANEMSYERRYKLIDAAYGKLLKVRRMML